MKTTTNKIELKKLKACEDGYHTFAKAHGDKDVKFSQCLESNGWDDVWWLIPNIYDQMSEQQKTDLRLLGCEYALTCIDNFEREFPDDKRPRLAIEAVKSFAKGGITKEELESAAWSARSAAESAAESARSAAWSAAWSARSAAESAAWSAAESAAWSAAEPAAWSAAWSAAESAAESAAWSAAESAKSAARSVNERMLMDLFLKWETQ